MSNITFSGLASGLDTNSLIAGLVNAERAPITRLQAKQSLIDSKSRKLTTLKTRLDDLRTAALALDSRSEAMPTKAKSADESVLVATGSGGASLGRFDVRVERLASAPKVYSNGFSARDATGLFGTGTLSLAVGSSTANLTIDGTDTLDSVVSKVNNAGLGLTAGVLFDGTQYRLRSRARRRVRRTRSRSAKARSRSACRAPRTSSPPDKTRASGWTGSRSTDRRTRSATRSRA